MIRIRREFFISNEFSNLRRIASKLFIARLLGKRLLGEEHIFLTYSGKAWFSINFFDPAHFAAVPLSWQREI